MAKKFDPKAKAKRQKVMAGIGAVLLLGLLAFQIPRVLKMMNQEPPPITPVAAPATVPGDPSVLPTPGQVGGGAAPAASGDGTLVDSDVSPSAGSGQLVSFGRFASKDPFTQQIDEETPGASTGDGAAVEAGGEETGGSATPTSGGDSGGGAKPAGSASAPSGPAVIAVNGVEETVSVGGEFPKDTPVFKLVKLVSGGAKIAIAGGAFASGDATMTLPLGKAVTLVNTADGTRYELEFVSIG